ncbi:MAG: hypothetical protein IJV20_10280 [Prevotella sp.]|nr:hypothetical protein [Prevotella sp.]
MRRLYIFQPHGLINAREPAGKQIASAWLKHQIRNGFRRVAPNVFPQYYKGSQWFSITSATAHSLLNYAASDTNLLPFLRDEFAPEECYIPTVVVNACIRGNVVNNNLRYIRWRSEHGSNPSNLGLEHFEELRASDAFFARKMEPPWCIPLIQAINQNLLKG